MHYIWDWPCRWVWFTVYNAPYKPGHTPTWCCQHCAVWVGLVLCCLMTPGLSKDIRCHVWPYFFWTCTSPDQTLGHTQSGLSAWWLHTVISIFLRVCVGTYGLTYSLYHPRGACAVNGCVLQLNIACPSITACVLSCAKKPVTTMLTYPWKCTVTWKPLVLMT